MPRTTAVTLDDDLAEMVDRQIASGIYATPEEVIRAGLVALDEHGWTLEALREEIRKGEESGEPIEVDDIDAFFDGIMAEAFHDS